MNKIIFILLLATGMVFLNACTGPEGPRGPQGSPGTSILSEVFEVTGSFSSNNDYTINVPLNPAIYSSDVVLIYELSGDYNGNDIWTPLPITYYIGNGDLRYFYDFSRHDIQIYLDTNLNPASLPDQYRINKTFRVVIVPGYFSTLGVDVNDFNAVMKKLELTDDSFRSLH